MPLLRFVLAIPSLGQVDERHVDQAINLARAAVKTQMDMQRAEQARPASKFDLPSQQVLGFELMTRFGVQTKNVAHSRNKLLWNTLRTPAIDWLLMCDSDNFTVDGMAVMRMLETGVRQDAAMIGAPVMSKHGLYNAIAPGALLPLTRAEFTGRTLPVDRIGAAFIAIDCAWMRQHWPRPADGAWFSFKHHAGPDGEPLVTSEDHVFCDGIRERGGKILCYGGAEPYHEGAPYPAA